MELYRVSLSALCSRRGVARRIEAGEGGDEAWKRVALGGRGRADEMTSGGGERAPLPRCSWQAVIFSVYPIVNAPWPAVCHASAVSN